MVRLVQMDRKATLFIATTIIWTWAVLSLPVICGSNFTSTTTRVAYVFAGASPSAIALLFVFLSDSRGV